PYVGTVEPRDEVGALGAAAEELAFKAGGGQHPREELLGLALASRRTDGVETEQPLEQRDRLCHPGAHPPILRRRPLRSRRGRSRDPPGELRPPPVARP